MAKGNIGRLVQVTGAVVDIEFPPTQQPEIFNAVEINREGTNVIAEVQQQLGNDRVRCIVMDTTDGLRRGMEATDTGAPIAVPVGPSTLGRIFDVVGKTIDYGEEVKTEQTAPIHRHAPSFEDQVTTPQFFETGMKVVDLIAPFTKGGKIGVFGGAGVGKTVIIQELIRTRNSRASRFSLASANVRAKAMTSGSK
jgi:F-type H+-transporting ATPase subunit beta